MSTFTTKPEELFAKNAVEKFFEIGVTPMITNDDYEGEITGESSILNIITFGETQGLQTYSGANLTLGDVTENNGQLLVNQKKAYYFRIKSFDRFVTAVKDPESTLMIEKAGQLQEAVDAYVLGLYTNVGSGNRVGTDYVTGTVTVTTGTGAVTGVGTTFTAAMVGLGFKAAGHAVWYRISAFTSTTAITIIDDKSDEVAAYTGGTIGAGAAYVIEAATVVTVTATNVFQYVLKLKRRLDTSKVPKANRWIVWNSYFSEVFNQASIVQRSVDFNTETLQNGYSGRISTFDIYENEQIAGNSTTGFYILAGHKSAITFAMAFVETGIEDLTGNFGKAYKGLNCYGAKVLDERRKALAYLWCILA